MCVVGDARQGDVLLLAVFAVLLLAVAPPVGAATDAYAAQEAGVGRAQLLRRGVLHCSESRQPAQHRGSVKRRVPIAGRSASSGTLRRTWWRHWRILRRLSVR